MLLTYNHWHWKTPNDCSSERRSKGLDKDTSSDTSKYTLNSFKLLRG